MSEVTAVRRPVVVTVAVVLVAVSGVLSTGLGILVMLARYDVPASDVLTVSLIGAGVILFGLLTLAIAAGIGRGSRLSRLLLTLYLVAGLALAVVTIVTTDSWDWSAAVQIVVDVLLLGVVWLPPGRRYFTSRAPAPDPFAV